MPDNHVITKLTLNHSTFKNRCSYFTSTPSSPLNVTVQHFVTLVRRKVKGKVVFVYDIKEYEEMDVEVRSVSNAALNGCEASA